MFLYYYIYETSTTTSTEFLSCAATYGSIEQYLLLKYTVIENETEKKAHHVCAEGNLSVDRSSRWIWNFWNPFIPSKAPNPCKGTLLVPVTNWRNFARSAWSKERKALQNHWICDRVSKKSVIKGFTPGIRYPIGISHKTQKLNNERRQRGQTQD